MEMETLLNSAVKDWFETVDVHSTASVNHFIEKHEEFDMTVIVKD